MKERLTHAQGIGQAECDEIAELRTLAEQMTTLDGFRWLPGMADVTGVRVASARADGDLNVAMYSHVLPICATALVVPNLTDPLTVEGLVVLMRERDAGVHMRPNAHGWRAYSPIQKEIASAEDYALAVARAATEVLR